MDYIALCEIYKKECVLLQDSCRVVLLNPSESNMRLMAIQLGAVRELLYLLEKMDCDISNPVE